MIDQWINGLLECFLNNKIMSNLWTDGIISLSQMAPWTLLVYNQFFNSNP